MKVIRTVKELSDYCRNLSGKSLGLVPTMGALHEGHLSLVNRAKAENDVVVVSVFVNPTQFNNQDDLIKYPRTEESDKAMLEEVGVDAVFIPSAEEVYPEPDTRTFDLGKIGEVMEGAMRPGHFNGVCQIVSKLFDWVKPDKAYCGEKDIQQIAVIKRMVELEGFNLEIVECEIKRHPDGLAMSSRNKRLSASQRRQAPEINRILTETLSMKKNGFTPKQVIETVTEKINSVPELEIEYYSIVDSKTMQPIDNWNELTHGAVPVGCIAVYCGDVRLIDNIKYLN